MGSGKPQTENLVAVNGNLDDSNIVIGELSSGNILRCNIDFYCKEKP